MLRAFSALTIVLVVAQLVHGQAPDAFEPPVVVDAAVGVFRPTVEGPRLATDGQGTWLAAWSRTRVSGDDFDVFFSRSVDDGTTWSPSAALNTDAAIDTGADHLWRIQTGGGGTTLAVWNRTVGSRTEALVSRSTDAGLSWSPPARLDPANLPSVEEPVVRGLATDGAGTWVVALRKAIQPVQGSSVSHSIVQLVRSDDDGATWSAPLDLTDTDRHIATVDIAASGAGTFIVTWGDQDGLRVARSTDGGISWASPSPIGPGEGNLIATDGAGGWLIHAITQVGQAVHRSIDDGATWSAGAPVTGVFFRQLFFDAGGALLVGDQLCRSMDGGSTWGSPVVPVIPLWTMATDGTGGWIGAGALDEEGDPVFIARGRTVCPVAPVVGCFTSPPGGVLIMKQPSQKKRDKLSWRWKRGDAVPLAALGDPTQADSYALCGYDATGNVLLAAEAPAGGTCGTRPCWSVNSKGIKYRNAARVPDGIKVLKAKSGDLGTTTASVKAGGERLTLPVLDPVPLQLPLTVQMHATTGSCWEATYTSAFVNKPGELRAQGE